jgi:hypothetical protein
VAIFLTIAALVCDPCLLIEARYDLLISNKMQCSERPLIHNWVVK